MGKDKPQRVEVPMLRAYLRDTKFVPQYAFDWPEWGGWVVFGVFLFIPVVGCPLAIIAAAVSGPIARNVKRPRTEEERMEMERYRTARRLKSFINGGTLQSHVPADVLAALEQAAVARHAALVRVSSQHPYNQILHQAQHD